jgi:hypothetical protein
MCAEQRRLKARINSSPQRKRELGSGALESPETSCGIGDGRSTLCDALACVGAGEPEVGVVCAVFGYRALPVTHIALY